MWLEFMAIGLVAGYLVNFPGVAEGFLLLVGIRMLANV